MSALLPLPLPLAAVVEALVGEALVVGPEPEAADSEDEKDDEDEDGTGIESARTEAERVAPLRKLEIKSREIRKKISNQKHEFV